MASSISFSHGGSTDNLERFLKRMHAQSMFDVLDYYAQEGVVALEAVTPQRSGLAAGSWYYEIHSGPGYYEINWKNDDVDVDGVPIVILLQYGHGTGTGGYVQGYDFINPATKIVFDRIEEAVWKAVQSA